MDLRAVLLARAEAALLGTLAVLGVWWLTRLLFDDRAAHDCGNFGGVLPGGNRTERALILSEAPFCPLMLLQLGALDDRLEVGHLAAADDFWDSAAGWLPGRQR